MMIATLESRAHGLHRLVGNTPLLAIEYRFKGTVQTSSPSASSSI